MIQLVAALLILLGSILAVIAAAAQFRLPEVFGRMHAATKPAVLGQLLLLTGTAIILADWSSGVHFLLAGGLLLFTAPVAMHVVGRAVGRVVEVDIETADDPAPSD